MKKTSERNKAFSLIELLVVIGIIAVMAGAIFAAVAPARGRARDARRKAELNQIGQLLYSSGCFVPTAGVGNYDLADLVPDLMARYPQFAQYASMLPKDPKSGNSSQTNYRYEVTGDGHCVLYANLENENEPVTLSGLSAPTPNSGNGVLKASSSGSNGTDIFLQISK